MGEGSELICVWWLDELRWEGGRWALGISGGDGFLKSFLATESRISSDESWMSLPFLKRFAHVGILLLFCIAFVCSGGATHAVVTQISRYDSRCS